ncbi:MAG: hypothetical protein FJ297_01830 [Planctomycetes bacterium]|nr:hypothetical protein [Planctomycetota bacterium]
MYAAIALSLIMVPSEALGPGDHTRSLSVDGRDRSYVVHVPRTYDRRKPTPVVLAFHGGGTHAETMVAFSGLNRKSDQAGFIVVYPNGTGRLPRVLTFHGGNCCGYAMTHNVDDVNFTRKLLDDLALVCRVDSKRVYATGMSNGAIMAYRLASELSDRIAAIAPVAGTMGTETCRPKRPVSVIHFHGTDDEHVPIGGGKGVGPSGTEFHSVEHSIRAWVESNGCQNRPTVATIADTEGDGTSALRTTYGQGRDGSEVVLVEIRGMGHTWPGQPTRLRTLGKSTANVSANDLMWEFFEKHPMP